MKLSEIFVTVQGEGPNVGVKTVFVRFGGCNLRCPGWGTAVMPNGEVRGSCDTPYAVWPEFRDQWEDATPASIMLKVNEIRGNATHVCITGGEPLTQRSFEMDKLAEMILSQNMTIDLFTNGTRRYPEWAHNTRVTVCMDYKMPSSLENDTFLEANLSLLETKDMIKLVVDMNNEKDRSALDVVVTLIANESKAQIYIGPVWESDTRAIADYILEKADRKSVV